MDNATICAIILNIELGGMAIRFNIFSLLFPPTTFCSR